MNVFGRAAVVVVVIGVLAAAFVTGGDRAVVDWTALRAVVIESDDWGLAGFVPAADAWDGVDRAALDPGRFPDVYWGSTLEDSAGVRALADVLASVRDRDGFPAVLQANYVTGSWAWEEGRWMEYALPAFPAAYQRPGLAGAVATAVARGVWRPEWHAAWHYDPELRKQRAFATDTARQATARGIMLFPGSERSRELRPDRPLAAVAADLDTALGRFTAAFGRPAAAVVAPDYTWTLRNEEQWLKHGLRIIQAKREQRHPGLRTDPSGRALKFLLRRWDKLVRVDRTYLERNCRFEPVQFADPAAVTDRCLAEVRWAWGRGEPAIVESHRVNFAHTDPAVVACGLRELSRLLAGIAGEGPVFLTDTEVAQLSRRGTSVRSYPGRLVLRNGTHSRRVVAVGAADLAHAGAEGRSGLRLVLVEAGRRVDLARTGR